MKLIQLQYVFRKRKITDDEEAVLAQVFGFFPLPENVTLDDYNHVDVKEFFRTRGTDYSLELYVTQIKDQCVLTLSYGLNCCKDAFTLNARRCIDNLRKVLTGRKLRERLLNFTSTKLLLSGRPTLSM